MLMPISPSGFQSLPGSCPDSDQVHVYTGNLLKQVRLFSIPTVGPSLSFGLYHNSLAVASASDVGIGWRHSAQASLTRATSTATEIQYLDEGGREATFTLDGSWSFDSSSPFQNLKLTSMGSGIWQVQYLPSGEILEFEELSGTPVVMRLRKKMDHNGNALTYSYDAGGKLIAIEEGESERSIVLEWNLAGDRIVAVTDPKGNRYQLEYEDDLLTAVELPGGCRLEYAYDGNNRIVSRTDRDNASTLYSYSSGRLSTVEEPEENSVRATHTFVLDEPVTEVVSHIIWVADNYEFTKVRYINPRGKTWEYRFNVDGTLWRVIDPQGRHQRNYYDENQQLLYSSEGYERKNIDDVALGFVPTAEYFGPRDNVNNQLRRFVRDKRGNLVQAHDSNGKVDAYRYDENSRVTSIYPGQAHLGVKGQWKEHFGKDGIVLCGHRDDHADIASWPDYLDSTTPILSGDGVDGATEYTRRCYTRAPDHPGTLSYLHTAILSHQVLEGLVPAEGDRFTQQRQVGMWHTPSSNTMGFRIQLNEEKAFNLSLYTQSLDPIAANSSYNTSLVLYEIFGRAIEFQVTDLKGTQKFFATQNASGVWATFPVVGDPEHPILVKVVCHLSNNRPCISAIAFDVFEDRRVLLEYDEQGNLTKQIQPTSDPNREVAVEYDYNEDGTLQQVMRVERVDDVVVEQHPDKMFYQDAAKNLTRYEDALNEDEAPTLLEYDVNGNLTKVTDPDGRQTQLGYDDRDRVNHWIDGLGRVTEMTYDGRGMLAEVKDPLGRVTHMEYTPSGRLSKVTDAMGQETLYEYELDGLLKSMTDPRGNVVTFAYDDVGNMVGVTYPECEVVHSDFSREELEPSLRFAYDVWSRMVAVTPANGNQTELERINLLGAVNVLKNPGAEEPGPRENRLPATWHSGGTGAAQNYEEGHRTDSESFEGEHCFASPVFSNLSHFRATSWYQRKVDSYPGNRYLMRGAVKCSSTNATLKLAAVVRQFDGSFVEAADGPTALSGSGTWEQTDWTRVDSPGDGQVTATLPAIYQFRAEAKRISESGTVQVYLDQFELRCLSDSYHYDGEYLNGVTARDGGKVVVHRDRFGRPSKVVDPQNREIRFLYDAEDRILRVEDTQGLTLGYSYDFLGNLIEFEDSRGKTTVFEYDALNRLTKITQPALAQEELFSYSPAGDLLSYTNVRGELREFVYDKNHRLVRIDYHLPGPSLESVSFAYDKVGNMVKLVERNGDKVLYSYDKLNRAIASIRKPSGMSDLPAWALRSVLDAGGNRVSLQRANSRYGSASYGQDRYLAGEAIWSTPIGGIDSHNRRVAIIDPASEETAFAYDIDGRLAEVIRPNGSPSLKDRYVYDSSGRLLEALLTDGTANLWNLRYGYSAASDRVSQTSHWAEDGNSYDYQLDSSGRLQLEAVNRFVDWNQEHLTQGSLKRTQFASDGKLRLLAFPDTFGGKTLDLQRWEVFSHQGYLVANNIRQDDGLHLALSRGVSGEIGRYNPPGDAMTLGNQHLDYPDVEPRAADYSGYTNSKLYALHRGALQGAFEITVDVSDLQLQWISSQLVFTETQVAFGVTVLPFETSSTGNRVPTSEGYSSSRGGSLVLWRNGAKLWMRFNGIGVELDFVEATQLRLERYLDGSTWKLKAFYFDGEDWVLPSGWTATVSELDVHPYLEIEANSFGYGGVRFTNFESSQHFRVSEIDEDEAINQATWSCYESTVFDAGRSTDWERIQWVETLPNNTDIRLQVAVSNNPEGPWDFVGPDGEGDTYFTTPAGENLPSLTGRYCKYRAFLISTDGLATPELSKVQIAQEGSAGSFLKLYHHDDAGNLLEIETHDNTGATIEVRTVNDLNQITTSTGSWVYSYDSNGCLTEKTNGTGVGDELWEYSWDPDDRLVQVSKGVYTSGSVLVNEFTVNYSYDSMGRMLRRDNGTDVTTFVWDGWDLLSETTDPVTTTYLVPDGLVWSFSRGEDVFQVHTDALGSVRVVTDSDGDVVARFEFDGWGALLPGSFDNVGLALRFIGGYGVRTDLQTGLLSMRHRWYDATLQRFISRDPIGIGAGANLYVYCNNDPINFIDPDGLLPSKETYVDIYKYAAKLRERAKAGEVSGLDATFSVLDRIAEKSTSVSDFEQLARAIFIPNSSLGFKERLICPTSSLQGDEDWLDFPTTGWGKGWRDIPHLREGNPDYDQIHHFTVFMYLGLYQPKKTGHRMVRTLDKPTGPDPNWADIWVGDAGVDFGADLLKMRKSGNFSPKALKSKLAALRTKFAKEPTYPKR